MGSGLLPFSLLIPGDIMVMFGPAVEGKYEP